MIYRIRPCKIKKSHTPLGWFSPRSIARQNQDGANAERCRLWKAVGDERCFQRRPSFFLAPVALFACSHCSVALFGGTVRLFALFGGTVRLFALFQSCGYIEQGTPDQGGAVHTVVYGTDPTMAESKEVFVPGFPRESLETQTGMQEEYRRIRRTPAGSTEKATHRHLLRPLPTAARASRNRLGKADAAQQPC